MTLRHILDIYLIFGVVTFGVAIFHRFTHADEQASEDDLIPLQEKTRRRRWEDRLLIALVYLFVLVGWPAILYMFYVERQLRAKEPASKASEFCIKQSDLIRHMSVAQIETLERIDDPMHAAPALPFGHLNKGWCKFIAQLRPGDAVWSFSTNWTDEFQRNIRDDGYVIVRDGLIGDHYLTRSGYEFSCDGTENEPVSAK